MDMAGMCVAMAIIFSLLAICKSALTVLIPWLEDAFNT